MLSVASAPVVQQPSKKGVSDPVCDDGGASAVGDRAAPSAGPQSDGGPAGLARSFYVWPAFQQIRFNVQRGLAGSMGRQRRDEDGEAPARSKHDRDVCDEPPAGEDLRPAPTSRVLALARLGGSRRIVEVSLRKEHREEQRGKRLGDSVVAKGEVVAGGVMFSAAGAAF
jgi:hypothetical protein